MSNYIESEELVETALRKPRSLQSQRSRENASTIGFNILYTSPLVVTIVGNTVSLALSTPIEIADGGTGGTTASDARDNLGIDVFATKKSNLSATAAPTVNDDEDDGYDTGSLWIDTANVETYVCVDATAGAAVWQNLSDASVSLPFVDSLALVKGSSDPTKRARLEVDTNVSAGQTRVLTVQDQNGTIALLGNKLSSFASTTSAELASVISDETGTGALVFANSPTLITPALGTPSGGVLSNCTGLPIASGVAGLGTGIATFLGTPSSANLASVLGDETGSASGGVLVFNNGPTIIAPTIAKLANLTSNGLVRTSGGDGTLSVDTSVYLTANQTITLGGDVSGSGSTSITVAIGSNKVTDAMLRTSAALSVLGRSANSIGNVADIQVTATSDGVLRESGGVLAFGAIATAGLSNSCVSYAKIQNISATQRVLGRNTAGSGVTEEVTATQLLDWIGSTRGSILYRGASGWAILTPGTSGYLLTSNGAGADPSYQAAAGANTALSNLSSVSINTSLIPQTGVDLGAAATAFRHLWLYGGGTFGSHSLKLTGTPTANRVLTIPDVTDTLAVLGTNQTFTAIQTFGSGVARMTSPRITTSIFDANGNTLLGITATGSATEYITITNAGGGGTVSLVATTPASASTATAGTSFSVTAGDASAGFSTAGAAAGGALNLSSGAVGSSRVDLQACKLEYSIVSPK